MARLLFFLLLLAILGLGAHLWLSGPDERADFSARERNPGEVRIVAVTPPNVAARRAEDVRKTQQSLAGAACVEFSGIPANDAQRAREAFNTLQLGTRLTERRVEEITRHWVFIPPPADRRAAETRMADYIDVAASGVLPQDAHAATKQEILAFAAAHPIDDFVREWNTGRHGAQGESVLAQVVRVVPSLGIKKTAGSITEVAESVNAVGDVIQDFPQVTRWQTQLLLYDLDENTSVMATPTPVKTTRLTSNTNHGFGTATAKNQLMGIEAIIARPPQLVVTRAARNVVLARSRDPARLLRMYNAGSGRLQAMPAASVNCQLHANIRPTPLVMPMVRP